jgi:hypothetical protein
MNSELRNPNCQRGPDIFVRISAFINIYFDHCTNPHYHGAIKSTDMKAWQDISSSLAFPKGIRHGTILTVPEKIVEPIQKY